MSRIPICFYQNDGSGRDSYISSNNGGFYSEYRIINTKPSYQKRINSKRLYDPICFRPIKKYFSDGKGRDVFIYSQNSRNLPMARSMDLKDIVRLNTDGEKDKGRRKGGNPYLNPNGSANRKKVNDVLKRVFYANAENVPIKRMLPKPVFKKRNNCKLSGEF